MGNCIRTNQKKPSILRVESFVDRKGNKIKLDFKICISSIKILGLNKAKANLIIKFDTVKLNFDEKNNENEAFEWNVERRFDYSTLLEAINQSAMSLEVYSNEKLKAKTEIKISSIVNGPVHYSLPLFLKKKMKGRISLDVEMLEETKTYIETNNISCKFNEEVFGRYSMTVKYSSDVSKESGHSEATKSLSWNYEEIEDPRYVPRVEFWANIKTIRDSSIQIKIHKHHKSGYEFAGTCWLSFSKLFKESSEIYRPEGSQESESTAKSKLDIYALKNSFDCSYVKSFNEGIWFDGRRIGTIKGSLIIGNLPVFQQLIIGVSTEDGVLPQGSLYTYARNSIFQRTVIPEEIHKITEFTRKLKKSMISKQIEVNPIISERLLFEERKLIIDSLIDLLNYSQKESMKCFLYSNEEAVLKAQDLFIELGSNLIEYIDSVTYDIKPYFFSCLTHLIKRGELAIGYLAFAKGSKNFSSQKTEIAARYLSIMHRMLKISLTYFVLKGLDELIQEFVYCILVKAWFRIPEFRKTMMDCLRRKSFYPIEEWRNLEIDLEDEKPQSEVISIFDWQSSFYAMLPSEIKFDQLQSCISESSWKKKMTKRGLEFFKFLKEWVEQVNGQVVSQNIRWANIPGYPFLLKCMLLEMKEREILKYPDILVSSICSMLHNSKIINALVKILFEKTNIYSAKTVQETFKLLGKFFKTMYEYKRKIPSSFDTDFFVKGIKVTINCDIGLNIAKCLEFFYWNYHMIKDNLRKEIIYSLLLKKQFKRLFLHWHSEVRKVFCYLLIFRILSLEFLSFETSEDSDTLLDGKIKKKVAYKLAKLEEIDDPEQLPYLKAAKEQYALIGEEYARWSSRIPKSPRTLLYGWSDSFPYPEIRVKAAFVDLGEKHIDDIW